MRQASTAAFAIAIPAGESVGSASVRAMIFAPDSVGTYQASEGGGGCTRSPPLFPSVLTGKRGCPK